MAFIPAPGIVQCEVRALLDNQRIENRVMVDTLTTVTPEIVAEVANIFNNWVQGTYFDHLPQAVSLTEVVCTDMSSDTGSQHSIAPTGPFVGALSNAPLPNEVTFCVSLRTASRGRSARGRFYVLALQGADVTGNNLAAGRAVTFVDDINTLRDVMAGEGWRLVIVSYRHDNIVRPGGPVYFPVTNGLAVDLTVDSQRRRRPGVGT